MSDRVSLSVTGVSRELHVLRVETSERLHGLSRYVVSCAATDATSHVLAHDDPTSLVFADATLAWRSERDDDHERRVEHLFVAGVELDDDRLVFELEPALGKLARASDYRVFVDLDALAIVEKVLGAHGLKLTRNVRRKLEKIPHVVQKFERDLDFVSRLLADEGVVWNQGASDEMIASDHAGAFEALGSTLPVRDAGGLASRASVFEARVVHRDASDVVKLRDYDFTKPELDLTKSAGKGPNTIYEYPAGYRDPSVGEKLAEIRLAEVRQRAIVLEARSNAATLRPGVVLELDTDIEGSGKQWLVTDARWEIESGGAGATFFVRFEATPAPKGFRPARSRAPSLDGVENAVITGPSGAAIHTEEHARVRVHHRWDRVNARDDKSSNWARVAQPATSGSIFLPRVGWEVLLGFTGHAHDEPLVVGQLYNGAARPPSSLPAKKVVSAFGTESSPGGGGGHLFEIGDAAGSEHMHLFSSKDFNEKTENDKVTDVTSDDEWMVGTRSLTVGKVFQRAVTGSQTHVVVGKRASNVGANFGFTAASETAIIAGARIVRTGGDLGLGCSTWIRLVVGAEGALCMEHYNRFAQTASATITGASWNTKAGLGQSTGIGGVSGLRVAGPKTVSCKEYVQSAIGIISEKYASRALTAAGKIADKFTIMGRYKFDSAKMKASSVGFVGKTKVVVKAGGVTITLTPGKVKIEGQIDATVKSYEKNCSEFG